MPDTATQNGGKSAVRVERFDDLIFLPRFEYGHMAEAVETCGWKDGSELGSGFVRFHNARIPWKIEYDEMITVLEGELHIHVDGQIHQLHARDSIWLPSGSDLIYESVNALVIYAIHPSNWTSQ